MKTKNLLFAALLMISSTAMAGNNDTLEATPSAVKQATPNQVHMKQESNTLMAVYAKSQTATNYHIIVYDQLGNPLKNYNLANKDSLIIGVNMDGYPAGNYTFKLLSNDELVLTRTFQKY